MTDSKLNETDADRLELLDRIEQRCPEIDLDAAYSIAWQRLDDGSEALLIDGGGLDGGKGVFFANAGDDVHAVGSLAPVIDGHLGVLVIQPDGSRYIAGVRPDPLAGQTPE